MLKLFSLETGKEIREGDQVEDFRGDMMEFSSIITGKADYGKVLLRRVDKGDPNKGQKSIFFPSVINAEVRDV